MKSIRLAWEYLREDKLLLLVLILTGLSIIFGDFQLSYINFPVLYTLFGMMLVLGMFNQSHLLTNLSLKILDLTSNSRVMSLSMIVIAYVTSIFLSNDVAVLTILPLYLQMVRESGGFRGSWVGASMITIAANLGGVFFPFGNPQNLIIYNERAMTFADFLKITTPLGLFSFVLVILSVFFIEKISIQSNKPSREVKRSDLLLAVVSLIAMILSIFGLYSVLWTVVVVSLVFLVFRPETFKQVDYRLLVIFTGFFITVGNLSQSEALIRFLEMCTQSAYGTFFTSAILSQFISNVPTTMLIQPLTSNIFALLYGVNIGGLGSPVASLANLIGINVFAGQARSHLRAYMKEFFVLNIIYLLILSLFFLVFS